MFSKKMQASLLIALALGFACAKQNQWPSGRWIDLSHDFSSETIYWPTAEGFKLEVVSSGRTPQGFYYAANNFCAAEHGGTHIDSPIHFAEGRQTLDQIPLEQLIAPAVVIDVSEKTLPNSDYQISIDDFTTWENQHGKIPDKSIVLLRTGYGKFWPDRVRYMGTNKPGSEGVMELHFPGLHPEAARWLVANRQINAIGLDTPSIDYGQSKLFESHQILFDKKHSGF
jgi:kynurenine formamidase